jgi:hypothetical protein
MEGSSLNEAMLALNCHGSAALCSTVPELDLETVEAEAHLAAHDVMYQARRI